jgi:CheY-like chemotaxis protein
MPVMDGLSAAREIRQLEAALGLARTRIVALSANALPEHIAEAREAGMDEHLAKPIRPESLIALIATAHPADADGAVRASAAQAAETP